MDIEKQIVQKLKEIEALDAKKKELKTEIKDLLAKVPPVGQSTLGGG